MVSSQKQTLGEAAARLIQAGMVVGLGTGTTAACFIESLTIRCREGLKVAAAVASSEGSRQLALAGGIKVLDLNDIPAIDLTVDGADEIDSKKRMIKGGGGALLREKIIALASHEYVIIVEEQKCVEQLGQFPLALEIVPFGYKTTLNRLAKNDTPARLRITDQGKPFVTDNGNYIADISFKQLLKQPEVVHQQLKAIVGVVETGLFFNCAGRLLVASRDGEVEIR